MVSIVGEDIFENSLEEVLGDSELLKEKWEWVLETLAECEEEKNKTKQELHLALEWCGLLGYAAGFCHLSFSVTLGSEDFNKDSWTRPWRTSS